MSKVKPWIRKNIWWIHVVLAWGVLSLVYAVCYETCDDVYMSAFVNGLFGEYDAHVVFQNILLGRWYVLLNKICPVVNWYTWTQIIVLILSFSGVALILIKKFNMRLGLLLSVTLEILFWFQCFVLMQFTKTAGIAIASGMILIAYELFFDNKEDIPVLGLGAVLVIVGSMLRMDIFYAELLIMVPGFGLVMLACVIKDKTHRARKKMCRFLLTGIALCSVAFILYSYSQNQYTGAWADYLKHQAKVSSVMDYVFPYYTDAPAVFDSINISESDLEYYRSWNTADQDKLNDAALDAIKMVSDGYWVGIEEKILNFIPLFLKMIWKVPVFPILFLIIFFTFILGNWVSKALCLAEGLLLVMEYFYLYYGGRVFVNRVDVPIFFGVCLILIVLFERKQNPKKFPLQQCLCLIIMMELLYGGFQVKSNAMTDSMREILCNQKNFMEQIASDTEHIYLGTAASIPFECRLYTRPEEGAYKNMYNMGSWTVGTPITNAVLSEYGISNPYRDGIGNENVYYVITELENETNEYLKNYEPDAELILEKNVWGYSIYRAVISNEIEF